MLWVGKLFFKKKKKISARKFSTILVRERVWLIKISIILESSKLEWKKFIWTLTKMDAIDTTNDELDDIVYPSIKIDMPQHG